MKKYLILFLSIMFLSSCSFFSSSDAIITGDYVYFREYPDKISDLIFVLGINQKVNLLAQTKDFNGAVWFKIKVYNKEGWVFGKYIKINKKLAIIPEYIDINKIIEISKIPEDLNINNFNDYYWTEYAKYNNTHQTAHSIELAMSQKMPKHFERKLDKLIIYLENSKSVSLNNENENSDLCKFYSYLIYIPEINSHLIEEQWYEGSQEVLVNNLSGKIQKIWGFPIISPDKKRFFVVNKCLFSGYSNNGIQIYKVMPDQYIKEYEEETNWGPGKAKWVNNKTIVIEKFIAEKAREINGGTVTFNLVENNWIEENSSN